LFLVNAIEIAESESDSCNLRIFEEHPIHHVDLSGIGPIGGPVDFFVSCLVGNFSIYRVPEAPYLVVFEAKSSVTLGMIGSIAQLFVQIITLQDMNVYFFNLYTFLIFSTKRSQVGVLTDGYNWKIFLCIKQDNRYLLYDFEEIIAKDRLAVQRILGI